MQKKEEVIRLLMEGKSYRTIERETGASKSTIHYHAKKLGNPNKRDFTPALEAATRLIEAGARNKTIFAETGLSAATVCRLRRELGVSGTTAPTWTWGEVQNFYDQGMSIRDCEDRFKLSKGSIYHAKAKGLFETRGRCVAIPLEEAMVENSTYQRGALKRRLICEGLIENECSICAAKPIWQGKPLVLVLDHINGVNNDHRFENLRLLCPNCNSQTDTFAGRNVKRK